MDGENELTDYDLAIVERAYAHVKERNPPEHEWLFLLVGFIRGAYPGMPKHGWERFKEHALTFASRVPWWEHREYIRWDDPDSVLLEFEKAWESRKHVQGSEYLKVAAKASFKDCLGLQRDHNYWIARVATAGFYLQEMKPETPFLIPINPKTAALFNITPRTLGLAVDQAIKKEFFKITYRGSSNPENRKARRFIFNSGHPEVRDRIEEAREGVLFDTLTLAGAFRDSEKDRDQDLDPFGD